MRLSSVVAFLVAMVQLSSAHAGFNGSISFTDADRARHQQNLALIMTTAGDCLRKDLDDHKVFFAANGFSPFYGDQSAFSRMSKADRAKTLATYGKADYVDQMQPTSCIGITLKCLGAGFKAAGQDDLWSPINTFTVANALDGTALQHALRELGWFVLYWNPNTAKNIEWDLKEQTTMPTNPKKIWGYHEAHWQAVSKGKNYLYNKVDNYSFLVDFKTTLPADFFKIPFFVGTAHGGYHVFPGFYGHVIEGHSTRSIDDPNTIEDSPFNPLLKGGGPRGNYRSGIMAIPPSYK